MRSSSTRVSMRASAARTSSSAKSRMSGSARKLPRRSRGPLRRPGSRSRASSRVRGRCAHASDRGSGSAVRGFWGGEHPSILSIRWLIAPNLARMESPEHGCEASSSMDLRDRHFKRRAPAASGRGACSSACPDRSAVAAAGRSGREAAPSGRGLRATARFAVAKQNRRVVNQLVGEAVGEHFEHLFGVVPVVEVSERTRQLKVAQVVRAGEATGWWGRRRAASANPRSP